MNSLNNLEIELLKAIIKDNESNYPFLKIHFPHIYIKSREYTGVGIYVYFEYSKYFEFNDVNVLVTSTKCLTIDLLENELSFVLNITNGRIDLLEIVTNGDDILNTEIINFKLF
ncbi:MAG: hypothetical protein RO257_13485 [Candidatus Kapabacteria bacterium]|nr:hypothetical protein [Candidatus Kapabacteria bacterium]